MKTDNRLPTPQEFAESVLARRKEIARYLDEAQLTASKREINSFKALLRKTDKLIAEYGLDRYANRKHVEER